MARSIRERPKINGHSVCVIYKWVKKIMNNNGNSISTRGHTAAHYDYYYKVIPVVFIRESMRESATSDLPIPSKFSTRSMKEED